MPRVPTVQGPQVQQAGFQPVFQTTPPVGRDLQELGNALQQGGDVFDRIAARDDADAAFRAETSAKAAFLDFQDQARKRMQGENAKGFKNEVDKWWNDAPRTYGENLSPRAKALVDKSLAVARNSAIADAGTFEQTQLDRAQDTAWTASKMVEIDRAARAGDPLVQSQVSADIIRQRNAQQAALRGWNPDTLAAQNIEDLGKLHSQVVSTLIEGNDLERANTYLTRYADQMDVNHLIKARDIIKKQQNAAEALRIGVGASNEAFNAANPSPVDVMFRAAGGDAVVAPIRRGDTGPVDVAAATEAVRQVESGGRQYGKDGKLLEGPQTKYGKAKGDMQVLDGTSADPGFGVTPAKDNSADERSRVGRDYFAALVRRYGGDKDKAWAAYNTGPGNLDKIIAKNGDNWAAALPPETQLYLTKTNTEYQKLVGQSVNANYSRPTLEQVLATVRERTAGKPVELQKQAIEAAKQQYEVSDKAVKQREDEAVLNAQKWLATSGGRFSQLPPTLREAIPAGKLDDVMTFAQKVSKGDDVTDLEVFNKMATDDKFLRDMSEPAFLALGMRSLSQSDFKQMSERRGKLLNPDKANNKPGDLDYSSVNQQFNNRLSSLKIDPTPKDGSADAALMAERRRVVYDAVLAEQQARGKKLNDAEIGQVVDGLFAKNVQFQGTWRGSFSENLFEIKEVPDDIRDKIKNDFKARGILKPSDAQILGVYLRAKTAQQQTKK